MDRVNAFMLRRSGMFRLRLLAAAAVFAALAAAFLASAPASAQTSNDPRPQHQRVDADGAAADGFYYSADPATANYVRIHFISTASGRTDETPTYRDFGQLEIFLVSGGTSSLHTGVAVRDWWFSADDPSTALAACGNDFTRCVINKTEYQALAGQASATDSDEIRPITVAFKVPSSVTNPVIYLQSKHTSGPATRPGDGNRWHRSTWARVDKHAPAVTPLTSDGKTISNEHVFTNAAGNLGANFQHVRLSIGASHIPGFSSPTYAQWGTTSTSGLHIRLIGQLSGSGVNLVNNQVQDAFFMADETTALGCDAGDTNDCYITKATWQSLAGQTDAPDTAQIKPIRLAFKVPSRTQSGSAFDNTSTITFRIARQNAEDDSGNALSRSINTTYTRLVSHVVRRQSASRIGNTRTPLEPGQPLPAGATHSAFWCSPGDTGTDCTRALEVGEDMYIGQAITRGGTAYADGRFSRSGLDWLDYGPDYFDQFEISFTPTPGSAGGDLVISSSTLCPIHVPDGSPAHPFVDAPRDRTAAALRVCKWDHTYNGSSYRSVDNPDGWPYWDTGTGPHLLGIKAGTGTITVKHSKDGVLVGQSSISITIADATRANLLSPADAPMITAGLGQRDPGGPLQLQIGYERVRGIPAFWPGSHDVAGRGYYGPALYGDVDSVELTVPAGGGTLELLGTHHSCTAGSDPCTIEIDSEDLKQAARYGYTPADNADAIADSDAIYPARLLLHGAASRDVTISGTLTLSSGTPNTHSFSYTAKAAPNPARATVAAYLPGDSDGILAPGQSAPVAVGYQIPEWLDDPDTGNGAFRGKHPDPTQDASELLAEYVAAEDLVDTSALQVLPARQSDWTWTTYSQGETDFDVEPAAQLWLGASPPPITYRYSPVPGIWSIRDAGDGGYTRVLGTPEPAGDVDYAQPGVVTGAYLQITGPATWTETGGKRLRIDRTDYTYFKCVNSSTLDSNLGGRTCYVVDADGEAPSITADRDADGDIRITADLPLYVLVGAVPNDRGATLLSTGFSRPLNTHALRRVSAFGSGTIQVDAVRQLSSVSLDRTPDGNGITQSGPIATGSSRSGARLSLRNENGRPSQLSAVSAITLTVIGGGTLTGLGCTNASSCTLSTTSGALFDAVEADPDKTAAIDLTYNAPNSPGKASIRATVVGNDGGTFTETLDLTISGSAAALAIGGTMPRVHSSATENDDRDKIVIPISAQDANGNPAPMPLNAAARVNKASAPNEALDTGTHTATVKCEGGDDIARLRCNIEIVITASAATPLESGAYTATIIGTGIPDGTAASFAVGGPAETLTLGVPDQLPGLGQNFTATVSVVDKAGVPVADGTWVAFRSTATGGGSPSAIVTGPAEDDVDDDNDDATPTVRQRRAQTRNGQVSANITVVGNGITVLTATATSTNKSDSEPLDTRAAAIRVAEPAGPVLEYNTQSGQATVSAWATYQGTEATTADELLDHTEAPATARIVWLWNGVEWIRYGEVGGVPLPGSHPFAILPDDTIWFGD